MRIAAAVALFFLVRFATLVRHYIDGDLVWLRWLGERVLHERAIPRMLGGETFTSQGRAWIPHDWLFGVIAAAEGTVLGFSPAGLLVIAAAACTLVITAANARKRGASPLLTALVIICTGFGISGAFGIRAQVLPWPLLAMVIALIGLRDRRAYVAVLIVGLWANFHASAVIAPLLVAVSAAGTLLDEGASAFAAQKFVIAGLCVVALFATPLGWHMPVYAVMAQMDLNHSHRFIAEWQHPSLLREQILYGILPMAIVFIACLAAVWKRVRKADAFLAILALAVAASAVRHAPIAAIVLAPIVAEYATIAFSGMKWLPKLERFAGRPAAIAACAVIAIALGVFFRHTDRGVVMPVHAVKKLAQRGGEHRLFCENFAWCSLGFKHKNVRVFLDSRADPFTRDVWLDFHSIQLTQDGWRDLIDRYRVNAVLVNRRGPLSKALRNDKGWHVIHADDRVLLLVRRNESRGLNPSVQSQV